MTDITNIETPTIISSQPEKLQSPPAQEIKTERQKGLLERVKEKLPFWKQKAQTEPEKVVEEMAKVDEKPIEQTSTDEAQKSRFAGEPLTSGKVYYDTEEFKNETSPDNVPSYNWQDVWSDMQRANGVENPDPSSSSWEGLYPSMREAVVLNHYIGEVASFAKQTSPTDWEYVVSQSKGFNVTKNSNFAEVHEGSDFIGVNPEALMADVKSGDNERMTSAFVRLVHEAKHIEQNKYLDGSLSLPDGTNPVLAVKSFDGYMAREQACWKTEEILYTRLTGKAPERVWEDEDIQEAYNRDYSRWKNAEPTKEGGASVIKEIPIENLPVNVRESASYFLGDIQKVKETQSSTGEKSYSLYYFLDDVDNLFPGQQVNTEITVQEKQVTGKSLGNVDVGLTVNDQALDLSQIRNTDSSTEIRWAGGTGNSRRTDKVIVNKNQVPDVKLDKFKTTFDLVAFLHESSHTKQPVELLSAADSEVNLATKAYYSKAMEDDAWKGTRDSLQKLGLQVNKEKLEELITSFESEYKSGYEAALKQKDIDNLPEHPTIEDALKLLSSQNRV